jgi:hypothetical protein
MARISYVKIAPEMRRQIADLAGAKSGSALAKQFNVPERTVQRILAQARAGPLPPLQRRGRKPKYAVELDQCIKSEVVRLGSLGVAVSGDVIRGVALIKEAESSGAPIADAQPPSRSWAKRAVQRWTLRFRRGTQSVKAKQVVRREEKLEEFRRMFHDEKQKHQVPDELIVNVDQVGVALVPSPTYSYALRGARQVPITGLQDKRAITVTLGTSCAGGVLPPQVIYSGTTAASLPKTPFPSDWNITQTKSHWSNKMTVLEYITKVVAPFYSNMRASTGNGDRRGILILDHFSAHLDPGVAAAIEELNCSVLFVPAGLTGEAQPNDALFNCLWKRRLKSEFMTWYFKQIVKTKKGDRHAYWGDQGDPC